MFIAIANAIGAGGVISYISKLIKNFKTRILLASGIFEAEACLKSNLEGIGNDLLKQASLVITPTAYNAGTLFSVVPNTTLGDLSVVRATSATRVNEQGLIEIPRTNLLTNSDGNLSTYTTNSNVTDATTPINNFTNSIQFGDNSLGRLAYKRNFTPTIGIQYTLSVFVQMDDNSLPVLGTTNSTGDFGIIINANLATINPKIEQLGTTNIYRVSVSRVADSTNTQFGVVKYTTQSLKGFKITGIQLEIGNVATDYIPTTSVIRTRFAGITQDGGSANNIPRLDYTNASCPSILVEPQRTNLLLRSEEFDNAYWSSTMIRNANATTSPSGTMTADSLEVSGGSGVISRAITITNSAHSFSVYAKKGNWDIFRIVNGSSASNVAWFNLTNGTTSNVIGGTAQIIDVGNGWYRCIYNTTTPNTTAGISFVLSSAMGSAPPPSSGSNIFLWGAQLEEGSNATSYIPTQASTVTRNADVISKSGISSLIGQTEGTVFVNFNKTKINLSILSIDDGTTNNRIFLEGAGTSTGLRVRITNGGTTTVDNTSNVLQNGINKIALVYANNNVSLYRNGVLIFNDNSATIPNTSILRIGSNVSNLFQLSDSINSTVLWKTALTDQECINLTTI